MSLIAEQSNLYASQKNADFEVFEYEIRRFIGILFLSGYHTLPQVRHYWSNEPDFGVEIVKQSLPRNRFDTIKRFIHLADNNKLDKTDGFAKVRQFIESANHRFMQFGVFSHDVSIDEQMIPYYGRHSSKMFIKGKFVYSLVIKTLHRLYLQVFDHYSHYAGKPVRFGFKGFCLASANGYLYQIILYGGASTSYNKTVGLGASVVLSLLENVSVPSEHRVFFDKYFTSYHLMCLLNERGFFAAGNFNILQRKKISRKGHAPSLSCCLGTVKKNRIGDANLPEVSKKGDHATLFERNNNILAVRWADNANVIMLTNFASVEPLGKVKRYQRKLKKYATYNMPDVIAKYNQGMGGVDLHDNAVANYRIAMRGKKWWWPLFINTLDSMMVNAWKLHVMISKATKEKPLPQLDFRSEVTKKLLLTDKFSYDSDDNATEPSTRKLKKANSPYHFAVKIPDSKRLRCKVCSSQSAYMCSKCNVCLHIDCFANYEGHK